MKKSVVVLLTVMMIFAVSCTKATVVNNPPDPKSTSEIQAVPQTVTATETPKIEDKKVEEVKIQEVKTEWVKVEERKEEIKLLPARSFLKDANYNLPKENIYYTGKAVALMYHHISERPSTNITIKPERFESDLKMLKDNHFNVISMRDMLNAVEGIEKLPPNAIVITFDDGYESFYKYAYPSLLKYNMPAVNFVITGLTENFTPPNKDLAILNPEQIREMYKSGLIDIQSHSHEGHDYIVRNEKGQIGGKLAYRIYDKATGKYESEEAYGKRVLEDLKNSIPPIERYTDNKSDTFCFPFGHYNTGLVEIGKNAGFKYFITTIYGDVKENSKTNLIRRLSAGEGKLAPETLKTAIINCGGGTVKPATY